MTIYYQVNTNHPSLAGHFPGKPTVAGAITLAYIVDTFNNEHIDKKVAGIARVKFFNLLKPGQDFTIVFNQHSETSTKFECQLKDGTIITRGVLNSTTSQ